MYLDTDVVTAGVSDRDLTLMYEADNVEAFTKMFEDNNHNLNKPQKELLLWHS